ncbi:unannotated protein [freshwater metagenome]|uniref:Unannotated protein n=1 Tax=freshwater metagenome TaxID=449393 RepID=A0A6J7I8P5_9ZZZZ
MATASTAEVARLSCRIPVRPRRSESGPSTSRPTARATVDTEMASVDPAGVTSKARVSSGSSACGS